MVKTGEWVRRANRRYPLDDRQWVIETEDLTEFQAAGAGRTGGHCTTGCIPGCSWPGVRSIAVTRKTRRHPYTVRITLDQPDPRLRWGMTANGLEVR
jgi:hypothetical protein